MRLLTSLCLSLVVASQCLAESAILKLPDVPYLCSMPREFREGSPPLSFMEDPTCEGLFKLRARYFCPEGQDPILIGEPALVPGGHQEGWIDCEFSITCCGPASTFSLHDRSLIEIN